MIVLWLLFFCVKSSWSSDRNALERDVKRANKKVNTLSKEVNKLRNDKTKVRDCMRQLNMVTKRHESTLKKCESLHHDLTAVTEERSQLQMDLNTLKRDFEHLRCE